MSWLFGRRSDDEEDEDDEDYSEGDDYTSSDEDGEGDVVEDDDKNITVEKAADPAKTAESPALEEKSEAKTEPLQNGHPPAAAAAPAPDPLKEPKEEEEQPVEPEPTKEEPKGEDTPELETEKKDEVDNTARETAISETANANNADERLVEKEEVTNEDDKPEPEVDVDEGPPKGPDENEKEPTKQEVEVPIENGDTAVMTKEETVTTDTTENKDDEEKVEAPTVEEAKKNDDETQEEVNKKDTNDGAEGEEVEEVTSTHEKRSLLVLAAEHDRVDILKAILADDSEDRDTLLNSSIPPLHISIAYGSTNAVQCLLRMGADPSVRPDIQKIKEEAEAEGEEKLVDIPHMGRFDQLSAWELAFGKADEDQDKAKKKSGGWFGGGDGKKSNSIDIAPSKLEGIRHAFTAEGLRCIGSDEVERLKQLIDSGMPSTIDIGGKNLYDWAVEMGALQCEELLRPAEADRSAKEEEANDGKNDEAKEAETQQKETEMGSSAVLDRAKPGTESLSQLNNRIDELENLSKALSTCLDNLAEEVSVCHGLLLMGGGASALASHVRSLKTLKENKVEELERLEEAWENSEDELAYWVKECGEPGREIAELMTPAIIPSAENEHPTFDCSTPEEEQAHRQQLKAQAALLENKIRKLRASITDLSEESTRDLEEVEKRGLSGGINLVRTLRDEIREVEFALNETRSAEALCRAKIALIQSKVGQGKKQQSTSRPTSPKPTSSNGTANTPVAVEPPTMRQGQDAAAAGGGVAETLSPSATKEEPREGSEVGRKVDPAASAAPATKEPLRSPSDTISSGQSSAIALKKKGSPGYFTVDLWKILLRIIGLGSSSRQKDYQSTAASNVMIV